MYNHDTNSTLYHRVTSLDKGSVYSEGNLFDLRLFTGWSGSRVLYFGDHVYTDLADATLHHGWKTGAIIPELKVCLCVQRTRVGYLLHVFVNLCEVYMD